MKPIPQDLKDQVIKMWVLGKTEREIASTTGLGLGSVPNILKKAKAKDPEPETLRALNSSVRKSGRSWLEILRAAEVLGKLDQKDMGTDLLFKAATLLEKYENAENLLDYAQLLHQLEQEHGKPYQEVVREYQQKAGTLKEMDAKLEEGRKKEESLRSSISLLADLKQVDDILKEIGIGPRKLRSFINYHKYLQAGGFTRDIAAQLASTLQSMGMTTQEASRELAELLRRHSDLRRAIEENEDLKKNLEAEVSTLAIKRNALGKESEQIEDATSRGKQRLRTIMEEIKDLEEDISRLQSTQRAVKDNLVQLARKTTKIEHLINEAALMACLAFLIKDPEKAGTWREVCCALLAVLSGSRKFLKSHRREVRDILAVERVLNDAIRVLTEELRNVPL